MKILITNDTNIQECKSLLKYEIQYCFPEKLCTLSNTGKQDSLA